MSNVKEWIKQAQQFIRVGNFEAAKDKLAFVLMNDGWLIRKYGGGQTDDSQVLC